MAQQKGDAKLHLLKFRMERAMGIGPPSKAWEAFILPMNYARNMPYEIIFYHSFQRVARNLLVFAESSALLDRLSVMGLVLYRQLGGSFRIQRQLLTCEVCAV